MILAAALLVLGALGLFVGGIATGATAFYWACVALCVVAALLLVRVWWQTRRADAAGNRAGTPPTADLSAAVGRPIAPTAPPAEPPVLRRPAEPSGPPGDPWTARHRSRDQQPESGKDGVVAPDPGVPAGSMQAATAVGGAEERPGGAAAPPSAAAVPLDTSGEPPVEEVEVTDLLLVVDLQDEVLVVDEHPRYHLAGCPWLTGRATIPLPLDEARTDGFTPCALCAPDRGLADVERARRAQGRSS